MSTEEVIKLAKPKENTERVSFYISPEQLEQLREMSRNKGMSVSQFVRATIIEKLNNKK